MSRPDAGGAPATKLAHHPTVIAHRARRDTREVPAILDAAALRERCLAAGAHDVGFVALANPAIDGQRAVILTAFPRTQALISFVVRMNREDVRTPARSVANAEFHRTRDDVDVTARAIVAALERAGVPALNPQDDRDKRSRMERVLGLRALATSAR